LLIFLAETAAQILLAIKNTRLDKTILYLLSDDKGQLLKLINVDSIAMSVGLSSKRVNAGLNALAPVMTEIFKRKSNEIIDKVASKAWIDGDHLSAANYSVSLSLISPVKSFIVNSSD